MTDLLIYCKYIKTLLSIGTSVKCLVETHRQSVTLEQQWSRVRRGSLMGENLIATNTKNIYNYHLRCVLKKRYMGKQVGKQVAEEPCLSLNRSRHALLESDRGADNGRDDGS